MFTVETENDAQLVVRRALVRREHTDAQLRKWQHELDHAVAKARRNSYSDGDVNVCSEGAQQVLDLAFALWQHVKAQAQRQERRQLDRPLYPRIPNP